MNTPTQSRITLVVDGHELEDLESPHAVRRRRLDLVALFLAHQRLADRRANKPGRDRDPNPPASRAVRECVPFSLIVSFDPKPARSLGIRDMSINWIAALPTSRRAFRQSFALWRRGHRRFTGRRAHARAELFRQFLRQLRSRTAISLSNRLISAAIVAVEANIESTCLCPLPRELPAASTPRCDDFRLRARRRRVRAAGWRASRR